MIDVLCSMVSAEVQAGYKDTAIEAAAWCDRTVVEMVTESITYATTYGYDEDTDEVY